MLPYLVLCNLAGKFHFKSKMAGFFNSKIRKVQEALGTAQVTDDPQETKVAKEVRIQIDFFFSFLFIFYFFIWLAFAKIENHQPKF